jgi:hypothetical protein
MADNEYARLKGRTSHWPWILAVIVIVALLAAAAYFDWGNLFNLNR